MANVNTGVLFRAIQKIDPLVKAYKISDRISYELVEWTPEGGHRRLVSGDLDSLNAIGLAMAEKNKGLFSVGGGCGRRTEANFTGIDETDPRIPAAVEANTREWEEKYGLKAHARSEMGELVEPEEESESG